MSATAERQVAFTGLLRTPVVNRMRSPELWPLVRRHRSVLADWFANRLGYRLLVTDAAARLFRLPLDDVVVAPRRYQAPPRRVIVLAILAAAAAEDAEDITTTQDLSQRVRALTSHSDVELEPYEPDRFAHRLLFAKAVYLLASVGALWPTSTGSEEQGDGWVHRRNKIGGTFEVQREMLLRLADPRALQAAVDPRTGSVDLPDSAARIGLVRRLVELPVCAYDDLTEAERVYLTSQRQRVLAWCTEMTGWVAEQRAEGIALVAHEESQTDLPFPQLRAVDFTTLMVLDELLRRHGVGAKVAAAEVAAAASEVRARHPKALTNELKQPEAVEDRALELLVALDLLRVTDVRVTDADSWHVMPVAARFRNPEVKAVTARLTEEPTG